MNRAVVILAGALLSAGVVISRKPAEGPFFPSDAEKVAVISRGAEIDTALYLQEGTMTLFEFGGDW